MRESNGIKPSASQVRIVPLGAGCEVGRSCILVECGDTKILFDCGIHPAASGLPSLPVFDQVDLKQVSLCLVTHFHLDHAGAVPYLMGHTWFDGDVVMTEPTKAVCQLVWNDLCQLSRSTQDPTASSGFNPQSAGAQAGSSSGGLFNEEDVVECMRRIETMNLQETRVFPGGVEVTCFGAGHVVGACMFGVRVNGFNILYTGDYSAEDERHVPKASVPPSYSVQILICEGTYGIRTHDDRVERERRLQQAVTNIVFERGGKCLLPVFALGRVQELLLILEEHWARNPHLQHIPIIYLSSLSDKGTQIMREYAATYGGDYMRRRAFRGEDALSFRHVSIARSADQVSSILYTPNQPCVVFAAPGMLQSGISHSIFERWCGDRRNGVILTGFCLRSTLADYLRSSPATITRSDGREVPNLASFQVISFSAHADFTQTNALIDTIRPPNAIFVHAEKHEIRALEQKLSTLRPSLAIFTPQTLQAVQLNFPPQTTCRFQGNIAQTLTHTPSPSTASANPHQNCTEGCVEGWVEGFAVVRPNKQPLIVDAESLYEETGLLSTRIELWSRFAIDDQIYNPDTIESLVCDKLQATQIPILRRSSEKIEIAKCLSIHLTGARGKEVRVKDVEGIDAEKMGEGTDVERDNGLDDGQVNNEFGDKRPKRRRADTPLHCVKESTQKDEADMSDTPPPNTAKANEVPPATVQVQYYWSQVTESLFFRVALALLSLDRATDAESKATSLVVEQKLKGQS